MIESAFAKATFDVAAASLDPDLWMEAVRSVGAACNSSMTLFQMLGPDGVHGIANDEGVDIYRDYIDQGWHIGNPRVARGLALTRAGFHGLITEKDSFTEEQLARQPYQQEFAAKHGLDHEAGILAAQVDDSALILTLSRSLRAGAFSADEIRDMNRLLGGISSALQFALKLKLAACKNILDTLGARGEAAALLSGGGHILHATALFEQLLAGPVLSTEFGRLRAYAAGHDNSLQSLIAKATAWTSGALPQAITLKGPGVMRTIVRCLPIAGTAQDILSLGRLLVLVESETGTKTPDPGALVAAYGLTWAEARLAARLISGQTLADGASGEGITIQTARSRLKSIFEKTGVHRQVELVLLLRGP